MAKSESPLHRIKAVLYPNLLTENPNDYSARVISERSLSVGDICNSAVSRGGAATSAEAMEHNVVLFLKEMGYQLMDGYSVNTGYFTATTNVKGVFNSPTEGFNKEKHSVHFQFGQGEQLRKLSPNIEVEITGMGDSGPFIGDVFDVKSGTANNLLTPKYNLKIGGSKIKIVGDAVEVGVYFIHETTGARTKVDPTDIVVNNPSELIVMIPELLQGNYTLELQTQFSGTVRSLKNSRKCSFEKVLSVL